jgi:hypothetical protein
MAIFDDDYFSNYATERKAVKADPVEDFFFSDPNESAHPDKPELSAAERLVLKKAELAKLQEELSFWHALHAHTRLISRAEVLSRAVNQLISDASYMEPELNRLRKTYLPDESMGAN